MTNSDLAARLEFLSDLENELYWEDDDFEIQREKAFTSEQADLAYEALVRAPDSCDSLARCVVWILIRAKAPSARVNAALECGFMRHDLSPVQLNSAAGWIFKNGLSDSVLDLVARQFKWYDRLIYTFLELELTLALTHAFVRRRLKRKSKSRT